MKKRIAFLLTLIGLLGLLSGCSFRSMEELYTLPKLSEDYQNLQAKIEEVTHTGAEYAAPLSGSNTQPVQLKDLDGDGTSEAIAFFRVAGEEKPLKIYIFRQAEDGYQVGAVIEGDGTAINSVAYEDLNESHSKELVVSWQLATNVHTLAVYSIDQYQVAELVKTAYTRYKLADLDMDNRKEVVVVQVQMDAVESKSCVECYDADGETLVLSSVAPMSQGVTGVIAAQQGYLRDAVPALFLTSYFGEGSITDIFAWRDGGLVNITLEPEKKVSSGTIRYNSDVSGVDINGDYYLELPITVPLPIYAKTSAVDRVFNWVQYDIDGKAYPVFTTYHNDREKDGWYLVLPEEWEGKFTVSSKEVVSGERGVVFSRWLGEEIEPEPFLTIYKLTGANRQMRSRLGNRFALLEDNNTIYAAEFTPDGWDCGLDEDSLLERFRLVTKSWSLET